jgi:hypothetical protein
MGWQAHFVRGFLSGTINRKMRLNVIMVKREDGERPYHLTSNELYVREFGKIGRACFLLGLAKNSAC